MKQWGIYHQHVGDMPNMLVIGAFEEFVVGREAALDLGAGNLRDSRFLLRHGFKRVVAVDNSEESRSFWVQGIELHIASIEDFTPEIGAFDFIFSCNTLFYFTVEQVADIFQRAHLGLRSGGVFACNVLGEEDDWVVRGHKVSSFSEETLKNLCNDFQTLGIGEGKNYGRTINSDGCSVPKFWHQRSIAVRKF